jgi:hypothetical protein
VEKLWCISLARAIGKQQRMENWKTIVNLHIAAWGQEHWKCIGFVGLAHACGLQQIPIAGAYYQPIAESRIRTL